MADDQMNDQDSIDDQIRRAEEQLEERINKLRSLAADHEYADAGVIDDEAVQLHDAGSADDSSDAATDAGDVHLEVHDFDAGPGEGTDEPAWGAAAHAMAGPADDEFADESGDSGELVAAGDGSHPEDGDIADVAPDAGDADLPAADIRPTGDLPDVDPQDGGYVPDAEPAMQDADVAPTGGSADDVWADDGDASSEAVPVGAGVGDETFVSEASDESWDPAGGAALETPYEPGSTDSIADPVDDSMPTSPEPTASPAAPSPAPAAPSPATAATPATVGDATGDEHWAQANSALRVLQQTTDDLRYELPREVERVVRDELPARVADRVTRDVGGDITSDVERLLDESLTSQSKAIGGLEIESAKVRETLDDNMAPSLAEASDLIKELREDMPTQFERFSRELTRTLHDDQVDVAKQVADLAGDLPTQFEQFSSELTRAMQDETRLMRDDNSNVAKQVADLATDMPETFNGSFEEFSRTMSRSVHDDLRLTTDGLSDKVGNVETALTEQMQRIEDVMKLELGRFDETFKSDVAGPMAAVNELQESLPAQVKRLEGVVKSQSSRQVVGELNETVSKQQELLVELQQRIDMQRDELERQQQLFGTEMRTVMRDELASSKRMVGQLVDLDLGKTMTSMLEANSASLDRLGEVSEGQSRDRVQRVQDLENLLDTMTVGWQGLYKSMSSISNRVDAMGAKVQAFERTVRSMQNVEGTIEQTLERIDDQFERNMTQMSSHLQSLQPAPVVVTVDHPDASVKNMTQSGFKTGQE